MAKKEQKVYIMFGALDYEAEVILGAFSTQANLLDSYEQLKKDFRERFPRASHAEVEQLGFDAVGMRRLTVDAPIEDLFNDPMSLYDDLPVDR